MMDWNSYVQTRVAELMREAETDHRLKEALRRTQEMPLRQSLRERIGERLILLGWRMMNKQPQPGETCSRTVLSGFKQAIVMVEVCT